MQKLQEISGQNLSRIPLTDIPVPVVGKAIQKVEEAGVFKIKGPQHDAVTKAILTYQRQIPQAV